MTLKHRLTTVLIHSYSIGNKILLIAICLLHSYLKTMGTDWPKSAFFPFSSGKKRRSTAHTRMCSGAPGDLAPTSSKPAGTSRDSVARETTRRSLPAWQNPEGEGFFQSEDVIDDRCDIWGKKEGLRFYLYIEWLKQKHQTHIYYNSHHL